MGKERKSVAAPLAIAAIVLLPVIYIGSMGPAFWLCTHQFMSVPVWHLIYDPVLKTGVMLGLKGTILWYLRFFGADP